MDQVQPIEHQLNARLLRFRSQPEAEDPYVLTADLIAAARYGDARGVAVSAQDDDGPDARFLLLEGQAWFLDGQHARAVATLVRAAKLDPEFAETYLWMGRALLSWDDPVRAAGALERCLSVDPNLDEAKVLLHQACARIDEVEAEERAEAARAQVPGTGSRSTSEPHQPTLAGLGAVGHLSEDACTSSSGSVDAPFPVAEASSAGTIEAPTMAPDEPASEPVGLDVQVARAEAVAYEMMTSSGDLAAPDVVDLDTSDTGASDTGASDTGASDTGASDTRELDAGACAEGESSESEVREVSAPDPTGSERLAEEGEPPAGEAAPLDDAGPATEPGAPRPAELLEGERASVQVSGAAHDEGAKASQVEASDDPVVGENALPNANEAGARDGAPDDDGSSELATGRCEEAALADPDDHGTATPDGSAEMGASEQGESADLDASTAAPVAAPAPGGVFGNAAPRPADPPQGAVRGAFCSSAYARDPEAIDPHDEDEGEAGLSLDIEVGSVVGMDLAQLRIDPRAAETCVEFAAGDGTDAAAAGSDRATEESSRGQAGAAHAPDGDRDDVDTLRALPAGVRSLRSTGVTLMTAGLCAAMGYVVVQQANGPAARNLYRRAISFLSPVGDASAEISVAGLSDGPAKRALARDEAVAVAAGNLPQRATVAGDDEAVASPAQGRPEPVGAVEAAAAWVDPVSAIAPVAARYDAFDLEAARAAFDQLPRSVRESADGRTMHARLLLSEGKRRAALRAITPVRKAPDRTPDQLFVIGDVLHATGRVNVAAGAYELVLAVLPDHTGALVGRAEIHVRARRPSDAIELLGRARVGISRRSQWLQGRLYTALGHAFLQRAAASDRNRARRVLAKAVALPQPPAEAFFWLGEALAGRRTSAASDAYHAYLARAPKGRYADRARRAMGPLL
ncbi:MAG: hypothetical protein OXR73_07185 [Myxococcales bacterium]|nr:hypothetical protein [Myxococcales bacterium]